MLNTNWPASERPREKLLQRGAGMLSDAELIAIFLQTGTRGKSVLSLAAELLTQADGIHGLLAMSLREFESHPGLGPAKYVQLQAALELGERYLLSRIKKEQALLDPVSTRQFLSHKLKAYGREVFACVFLDNQHRVICYEELFFGTIDSAHVHPREVLKRVLFHNAAAVIFAHNHPSGVAAPSQSDQRITERLKSALAMIDTRVLDHMVIGDVEVTSFAELGLI